MIKKIIKEFHDYQKDKLGYIRYDVVGSEDDRSINVNTKNNLYSHRKCNSVSDETLIEKIEKLKERIG